MHREHVERVVDLQLALDELRREEADDAGDEADHERAHRADEARGRRDRAQARDHAGHDAEHARLAELEPLDGSSTPWRRPPRAMCVTSIAMPAAPFAASALPALKPNQPTQSSDAPVTVIVRLCGGIAVRGNPLRLPMHERGDERRDAGVDVHDGAAREVEEAALEQPAVRRPDPVRDGDVDDDEPQDREQQHRREPHALGERRRR